MHRAERGNNMDCKSINSLSAPNTRDLERNGKLNIIEYFPKKNYDKIFCKIEINSLELYFLPKIHLFSKGIKYTKEKNNRKYGNSKQVDSYL